MPSKITCKTCDIILGSLDPRNNKAKWEIMCSCGALNVVAYDGKCWRSYRGQPIIHPDRITGEPLAQLKTLNAIKGYLEDSIGRDSAMLGLVTSKLNKVRPIVREEQTREFLASKALRSIPEDKINEFIAQYLAKKGDV